MRLFAILTLAVQLVFQLAGQAPSPNEVRVASSGTHTLVVAPDGTVLCQGRNQYQVCGIPAERKYVEKLTPVAGVPKARDVAVADPWTSVVLGVDGRVYVWGQNNAGLFGGTERGPVYVRQQPTEVAGLERVKGIAAFVYGGAALRDDGTVWMWGEDREGLLGTGVLTKSWQSGTAHYTPKRVAGLENVVQIVGGSNHMLALRADGTVWVWGANKYGQLGLGDNQARAVPTRIPTLENITGIHAEGSMSAARLSDGSWLVWGGAPSAKPSGDNGPAVLTPSPLPGVLRNAADVAVGIVALRDGTAYTWGGNSFGSLGTGGSVDASSARGVLVKSLSGIVRVWAGGNRRVALKSDGTLYLWGPSGSETADSFRVPVALTTFKLRSPGMQ